MSFQPVFSTQKRPVVIAGPCSAETEEQVVETARRIAATGRADLLRAGIWKPRTRPGSFEGVGKIGLGWLDTARRETGLPLAVEVASAAHVEEALRWKIDLLWVGARSTANPFTVQEIADALRGADVPVLVKNPVNADVELWTGGIERVALAGVGRVGAIHRGFSFYGKSPFRNPPTWQVPLELMRRFPGMTMIGDPSHICGNRQFLSEIAQKCLDLNYDGLMIETHRSPDAAWSDAAQQVTPEALAALLAGLTVRRPEASGPSSDVFLEKLESLRRQIDGLDGEALEIFGRRMRLADEIGRLKRADGIAIFQAKRWGEVMERALASGGGKGLSEAFVMAVFEAVHQESIDHQARVMNVGG